MIPSLAESLALLFYDLFIPKGRVGNQLLSTRLFPLAEPWRTMEGITFTP